MSPANLINSVRTVWRLSLCGYSESNVNGAGEQVDHWRAVGSSQSHGDWSCPFLGPGQGEIQDHLKTTRTDPVPFWDQVKVSFGIIPEPQGLILPLSSNKSRWAAGPSENNKDWVAPVWDQVKVSFRTIWKLPGLILSLSGTKSRWALGPSQNYKDWSCPFLRPSQGELRDHLRTTRTDPAPFGDQVKVSFGNIWKPQWLILPPPLSGKRKCGSLSQTEIESSWNHKIRRFSQRARGKPANFGEQLVCINWLAFSFKVRAPLVGGKSNMKISRRFYSFGLNHIGLVSTLIVKSKWCFVLSTYNVIPHQHFVVGLQNFPSQTQELILPLKYLTIHTSKQQYTCIYILKGQ
jgi:hypothetical protein